ncbi:dolichyl-P-Man:Man(7)GlcNAc(2)-PP-dolichol alpha-1,6-mannosyltransferase LALA0_S02e07074g [Lachancea lanzarotensis]|uniref:Mannosyltransferase n=1 Tax=Lachancea lanzarotensis TaxID=1245769 RepID=A0A0C7MUF9_9SACH|nr:uncharacterized protein LALA0_S02e07074g [Lachancea lanzarotensis]CEP61116.1 LALA0S02e07074g1_1 [Lachancea lanzarotensis]
MGQLSRVGSLLIILTIGAHLYVSPYTKVEESFTIQAVHDILKYGIFDISKFDHLQYPGVVPRTFIGPLVIAAISYVPLEILKMLGLKSSTSNLDAQLVVRSIIGLTNALGFIYLKNRAQELLERRVNTHENKTLKKTSIGTMFSFLLISQFHIMYYSSRPLPNFVVAFPLVNVALGLILEGKRARFALLILAFSSIVFRLELAALTAGAALALLIARRVSFSETVRFGSLGAVLGAAASLYLDSYFWQNWTLPELDAFFFNVVGGESVKWGTMPFHAYLTNSLPTIFVPPLVLFLNIVGFSVAPQELKILAQAAYFHIFVLSFQPHKEWRFIVYTIPVLTLVASCGASHLFSSRRSNFLVKVAIGTLPLSSLVIAIVFSLVSSLNYPGGVALSQFNHCVLENKITNAIVHMDVPACMTGITKFGELDDKYNIQYDKSETLAAQRRAWPTFDYLISAIAEPKHFTVPGENSWELLHTTKAFSGIRLPFFKQLAQDELKNNFPLARQILRSRSLFPLMTVVQANITDDALYTFRRISSNSDT